MVSELWESSIHLLGSSDGTKANLQTSQEIVVEEPTQDLDVPLEAIREEEQKDSEDEGDRYNLDDHESEEEQPNVVLFTPEQLEVLLKMNRLDLNWLPPSKKDHPKVWSLSLLSPGLLMGPGIKRLWMLGLWKWKITFMPPRLVDIWPWNLPNLI